MTRLDSASTQPSVAVILPTYNGEAFIADTIASLLAQTYKNITVYIRDDGSSDNTVNVIKQLLFQNQNNSNRKQPLLVLMEDKKGNLGCPNSFYHIIRSVPTADYYAYYDQDDIWLPNKIERAVGALGAKPIDIPCVYFASFEYRTPEGKLIRSAPRQSSKTKFSKTLFYTPGLGFTIVFNRKACESFILNTACGNILHDRWILRCGAAFGDVIYDSQICAWHLRHEEAVTAADNKRCDLLIHFINNELRGTDIIECESTLEHFLKTFSHSLSKSNKYLLELYSKPSRNPFDRLRKALFPVRFRPNLLSEFLLRLVFLIGNS